MITETTVIQTARTIAEEAESRYEDLDRAVAEFNKKVTAAWNEVKYREEQYNGALADLAEVLDVIDDPEVNEIKVETSDLQPAHNVVNLLARHPVWIVDTIDDLLDAEVETATEQE